MSRRDASVSGAAHAYYNGASFEEMLKKYGPEARVFSPDLLGPPRNDYGTEPLELSLAVVHDIICEGGWKELMTFLRKFRGGDSVPEEWLRIPDVMIRLAPFHNLWRSREQWFSGRQCRFSDLVHRAVRHECGDILTLFTRDEWERWGGAAALTDDLIIRDRNDEPQPLVRFLIEQMDFYHGSLRTVSGEGEGWMTVWDILESAALSPEVSRALDDPSSIEGMCRQLGHAAMFMPTTARDLSRGMGVEILLSGGPLRFFDEMVRGISRREKSPTTLEDMENFVGDPFAPDILTAPVRGFGNEKTLLEVLIRVCVRFNHAKTDQDINGWWDSILERFDRVILKGMSRDPEVMRIFLEFVDHNAFGGTAKRLFPGSSVAARTSLSVSQGDDLCFDTP